MQEPHAVEAAEEGVPFAVLRDDGERVVRAVAVALLRVEVRLSEGVEGWHELRRERGQLLVKKEARAAAIAELQVENVLCAQSLRPVQEAVDGVTLCCRQIVGERRMGYLLR